MIKEQIINGQRHWLNHKGEAIPLSRVTKLERSASVILQKHARRLTQLSAALVKERESVNKDLEKHYNLIRKETEVDAMLTGNMTIIDLDQDTKFVIRTPKQTHFDETALVAVELIENYFDARVSDDEIRIFMKDILSIREKRSIDQSKLMVFYKHKTKDENFNKGIDILKKAEREETGKTYINLYIRPAKDQDWKLIPLNFSAITEE